MRILIRGAFRVRVFRGGRLVEDVTSPNALTRRGAVELLGRLVRIQNPFVPESFGNPISDQVNIFSMSIGAILEAGFVSLGRLDRIQYYDTSDNPVVALGDNRQWDNFGSEQGIDSVDFRTGDDPLPRLNETKPVPMPTEVASVFVTTVLTNESWRGLWVVHHRVGGIGQNVQAVIATSVLASPLSIKAGDDVDICWKFKLSPTFV